MCLIPIWTEAKPASRPTRSSKQSSPQTLPAVLSPTLSPAQSQAQLPANLKNNFDIQEEETEPSKPFIEEAATYLKTPKEELSETVIVLANQIDALFGNTRALDEYYGSTLHITQTSFLNTKGSGSYDIQTNLNLSLPNLRYTEERIRRWWSEESEEKDGTVTKKEFKELNPWEFHHGVGVRFSRPLAYNALARVSKNFATGFLINHFYEQLNWDSERLWEEVTSLNSDFAISNKLLFRFLNEADWGISNRFFHTYHGPSYIYNIDKISLASFDLRLITGTENNVFYADNYTLGMTYRTSLQSMDWVFIQLKPELSWPRKEQFTSVWTIYLTVDMVFGNKK